MTKRELRSQLRQKRAAIGSSERLAAAENLRRVAIRAGLLRRYQHIGSYLSFEGEMDTFPLLNQALLLSKHCYLPVVPPRFERKLWFSRLTDRPNWYHNRFGIHEHWSQFQLRACQLDLLFLPLVGFDLEGYRLGMGGGFYDASLAYLRRRKVWKKPYLVGIAFECQQVDKIPRDPWDMPLDAVLTEKKLYRFNYAK
jgi:5-formyltetrahydrofolate cyclo-ligase